MPKAKKKLTITELVDYVGKVLDIVGSLGA